MEETECLYNINNHTMADPHRVGHRPRQQAGEVITEHRVMGRPVMEAMTGSRKDRIQTSLCNTDDATASRFDGGKRVL